MYRNGKNELEEEINQLNARLQSSLDDIPEENEKFKQIEEQHQLTSDRLQQQRLILVNLSPTIPSPDFNSF